jgi:rhodanese-related sulfurtransferase/glyoxylase-like metal-dependent hydrolase (beta-lactamase superfamily II)
VRAIETHTHADHLSGHGRLGLEHGIPISIHPAAEAEYAHDALTDGLELELGQVVLRAIHTPGHRPEHTCLAVIDRTRADEPWLVLTGDSLFVGDTARPDLAVGAKEGAEGLFHSLRRLLELPDGVEVFPGHVAGSLCGKAMSSKASSTIGFERRFNQALQLQDELSFVAEAATLASPKPPNMTRLVELNRGPLVGAPAEVSELPVAPAGATVLDVRPARDYLAGHTHGALNVPVSGSTFATKAGFVLDPDDRIVVQAARADEAARAIRSLRAVGFLELEGYVLGAGTERIEPVELDELDALLEQGATLIDVRERDERDSGYIAGSRNIPYRLLALGGAEVPTDRPVVTICESGARAGIAASILAAKGIDARPVLEGGLTAWAARGSPMVEFRRCGGS